MDEEYIVVKTKQGLLRGHAKKSSFSGKTFYAFEGIPYAKPPLGCLRFKAPVPYESWDGVRDALQEGSDCSQQIQRLLIKLDPTKVVQGNEDCLYLNVATNRVPSSEVPPQPVMVNIHGGAFEGGSGGFLTFGPDFLLEGDIVFVSINYRCGSFGFLSLETEEVPGNAGLKDQTLALQWVQDNIQHFGGDPTNVTLMGMSAGAASVQFHQLSPWSRGLFNKGIVQGGSALNHTWTVQREPRKKGIELAKNLGCLSENPDEVLKFLQSASADDIVMSHFKMSESIQNYNNSLKIIFTPCIETVGNVPFLADEPEKLMKAGEFYKVPLIMGGVVNEATPVIYSCINDETIEEENKNLSKYILSALHYGQKIEETEAVTDVKRFYLKNENIAWHNISDYFKFACDILIIIGLEQSRDIILSDPTIPVYSYLHTDHRRCYCELIKKLLPDKRGLAALSSGTCHGCDAMYLFLMTKKPFILPVTTTEDRKSIMGLVRAWTSFALTGDPNYEGIENAWEKDSAENRCFIEFGENWTMRRGIPFEDRVNFWNELYRKYQ